MKNTYTTIGIRTLFILGMIVLLVAVTILRNDSMGTTFAINGLQLQVDSHATYNGVVQPDQTWALKDLVPGVDKFFNFNDVMPGDEGITTISLHTNQDAWACLDFTELSDLDNGSNEPEDPEDPDGNTDGELSKGMEFFSWVDDGDNVFEVGESILFGVTAPQDAYTVLSTHMLADSTQREFFAADTTKYVGIAWCAGDISVDTNTALISCDGGALGNIAQSDSFSIDVGLRTVTAIDHQRFKCSDPIRPEGLEMVMEKLISGPSWGFLPEQFLFHIVGGDIDTMVAHNESVFLPVGSYTIEEVGPDGFEIPDWRIQWSGDTCTGENTAGGLGEIIVTESDMRKITTYCRADNQYRPEDPDKTPYDSDVTEADATRDASRRTSNR